MAILRKLDALLIASCLELAHGLQFPGATTFALASSVDSNRARLAVAEFMARLDGNVSSYSWLVWSSNHQTKYLLQGRMSVRAVSCLPLLSMPCGIVSMPAHRFLARQSGLHQNAGHGP